MSPAATAPSAKRVALVGGDARIGRELRARGYHVETFASKRRYVGKRSPPGEYPECPLCFTWRYATDSCRVAYEGGNRVMEPCTACATPTEWRTQVRAGEHKGT